MREVAFLCRKYEYCGAVNALSSALWSILHSRMRIEELARPHPKFAKMYRDGKKGMLILLSNNCLVLPAVVMQQQEEISRNHVPYLFAVSVRTYFHNMFSGCDLRDRFHSCGRNQNAKTGKGSKIWGVTVPRGHRASCFYKGQNHRCQWIIYRDGK